MINFGSELMFEACESTKKADCQSVLADFAALELSLPFLVSFLDKMRFLRFSSPTGFFMQNLSWLRWVSLLAWHFPQNPHMSALPTSTSRRFSAHSFSLTNLSLPKNQMLVWSWLASPWTRSGAKRCLSNANCYDFVSNVKFWGVVQRGKNRNWEFLFFQSFHVLAHKVGVLLLSAATRDRP